MAPWKVRVNALRPIAVRDAAEPGSPAEEKEKKMAEQVPLGRIARPDDVGRAAAFLASDGAGFITGQVINVDGGMLEQSRPPSLELLPVAGPEDMEI